MTTALETTPLLSDTSTAADQINRRPLCKRIVDFLKCDQTIFYYCALISSWDDRSWYFLIGIYLVALDPNDLTLAATFGFLSSGLVIVAGSVIGSWIDRTSRIKASYTVLAVRNLSTLLSSVCLCLVFFYYDVIITYDKYPVLKLLAKICLIVFGVLAHVTGMTNNSMLTKDWLAVHCSGDNFLLSKMTSRFRLIDMVSKIIAPIIIGQIMTFAGKDIAAIVFSVQTLLTLLLFCFLLRVLYYRIPRLQYRESAEDEKLKKQDDESETEFESESNVKEDNDSEKDVEIKDGICKHLLNKCYKFIEGWHVYFKQRVVLAGLAMSLLYMTVLGFDTITTGYALSQGMLEAVLSLFNGGAAVTGIVGALVFPWVLRCVSSQNTSNVVPVGVLALLLQLIGLAPCLMSVWAPGSPFNMSYTPETNFSINSNTTTESPYKQNQWSWSLMLLMGGIVVSRTGLWMFDLTTSQLLIETVQESNRGKVNGVQNSLNMLFDLIKFSLVLIFPLPNQFGLLVILSFVAVLIGWIFYIIFAFVNHCRLQTL